MPARRGVTPGLDAAIAADTPTLCTLARTGSDGTVRAFALARLVAVADRRTALAVWRDAAHDPDPRVRRRAAEVAPRLGGAVPCARLLELTRDDDAWVAEAATFALGEHPRPTRTAIAALVHAATDHPDPLIREAAVAALGAIGDPATLPAVLRASDDKPAIRRRAVLALAAFDGPVVEARLQRALEDNDWQVRQAAEDLLATTP